MVGRDIRMPTDGAPGKTQVSVTRTLVYSEGIRGITSDGVIVIILCETIQANSTMKKVNGGP